jgi:D-beta-D-heptose 7-phosphate kinase/D-beta-D-heptose 1-phosphate adenosyltransferase
MPIDIAVFGDVVRDAWVFVKRGLKNNLVVQSELTTPGGAGLVAWRLEACGTPSMVYVTAAASTALDSCRTVSRVVLPEASPGKVRQRHIDADSNEQLFRTDYNSEESFRDLRIAPALTTCRPKAVIVSDYGAGGVRAASAEWGVFSSIDTPLEVLVINSRQPSRGVYRTLRARRKVFVLNTAELAAVVENPTAPVERQMVQLAVLVRADVVVTNAERPVRVLHYADRMGVSDVISVDVPYARTINTLGCGDIFCADLTLALLAGAELSDAVSLAAVGATCCSERLPWTAPKESSDYARLLAATSDVSLWGSLQYDLVDGPAVITNGCFDVLHQGHEAVLEHAAAKAQELNSALCVLVNSDESVRLLKGSSRPIQPLSVRLSKLHSLFNTMQPTARVIIACFDGDVCEWMRKQPRAVFKLVVKGGDWPSPDGAELCTNGYDLCPLVPGISTTNNLKNTLRGYW